MAKLSIQKTVKYETYGNPLTADTVLFVLHGYGQLAQFFIRKFHALDAEKYFIVAPEGMNRFYLKGNSGRVGASWMTKEERADDIQDNLNYLDKLWKELSSQYQFSKKALLGFSQGGATASRWLVHGQFNPHQFILWAAVFPPDMDDALFKLVDGIKKQFVFGDEDEYLSEETVCFKLDELAKKGLHFELIKFQGSHNIDTKTLLSLKV